MGGPLTLKLIKEKQVLFTFYFCGNIIISDYEVQFQNYYLYNFTQDKKYVFRSSLFFGGEK